jgi:HPt (histidine-containing phosphotransfer) domain-containing protein
MWEKIKKSNDKAQHLLDELENYKEETKKQMEENDKNEGELID